MEKPTVNFKPCFDWEMAEEPFGEAHQPEEPSQPTDTQPFAPPPFTRVATRKLQELLAEGYKITGYSIERQSDDPTAVEPKRGFCTAGGFVGWWNRPSNCLALNTEKDDPSLTKISSRSIQGLCTASGLVCDCCQKCKSQDGSDK